MRIFFWEFFFNLRADLKQDGHASIRWISKHHHHIILHVTTRPSHAGKSLKIAIGSSGDEKKARLTSSSVQIGRYVEGIVTSLQLQTK